MQELCTVSISLFGGVYIKIFNQIPLQRNNAFGGVKVKQVKNFAL